MRKLLPLAALTILAAACSGTSTGDPQEQVGHVGQELSHSHAPVCPGSEGPGTARCHAHVIVDQNGHPNVATTPAGLVPADLQAAYKLPSGTAGAGMTVG